MARKNNAEYQALIKEYKSLAKKADQRLVRLEKLSKQKGFENVTKWAYNRAMKDIQYWSGSGAKRFNRDIPSNLNSLKARINDVKHFLQDTKTSTKRDIINTFQNRANSINRKYGTNFKWDEMGSFFESKEWANLDKEYGSKTAMKALGQIEENASAIKKALKSGSSVSMRINDKKVQAAVNGILDEYGIDALDMY